MAAIYRLPAPSRRSSYAAAKSARLTGGWNPVDVSVNELIRNSGANVRARVRQLVRDFPYFARAVKVLVDYSVGDGLTLQSRMRFPDGTADKRGRQEIEDGWRWFCDQADVAGQLHLHDMDRLAKMQDVECGEFLLVKTRSKARGRYVGLALQMIEADWLTSVSARVASGNDIDQGVEYRKDTGEVVAYHFADPDSWGRTRRVDAADVIHGFETLRPGQRRGISPFVSGVLVTRDLQDIMDAELDGTKMASKWLAFVTSPDPMTRQASAYTDPNDPTYTKKIEDLENGILEYLRPGETVELSANPRPNGNFPPFVRLVLTMLSAATGAPYDLLSGDYSGLNWAVIKVIRNDFKQQLLPITARHVRQLSLPVFGAFLEAAVLEGRLPIRDYFSNPYRALASQWFGPAQEAIDALRQSKSDIDEWTAGLRSPQEIVGRRGRDLEEVVKEIADADKLFAEHGVGREKVSTALANNPAAVEKTGAAAKTNKE